ncbi:MAG: ArnT family glycosyltransferase [Chitinophagales bacterium]|jgi:4-amino-4-deoxy-L-arabinose transferase-like glycosyltransferase|nr:glycosyltransferase family 39 protein [Sphingobacteriales bacterium]
MFIDVMEIDAAQYALISMEMYITKSFMHVYLHGQDYLDKPPLLFWLSSLSFMAFGISSFAYKFPSVLIAIVGIYSLYRFTSLWYTKETAVLSALILATSQAMFLMTNDVRTDTILMGLVMFSIWQISEYLIKSKWSHLILASIGLGGAMMAKGPIALVIPAAAFGTDFLLKRQWKTILNPQWIVMLIIIAITLIPMSYGLYTQFDLHPEKTVNGIQGPSGLRFFYWLQSFGRITGENQWKNGNGYFYFFHTILWDFQPWILIFILAFISKIRKIFLYRFKIGTNEECISLGGFFFVFIALSMSSYKLPHYIFVLFPFASIITSDFIYSLRDKFLSHLSKIQFGIMQFFWIAIIVNFNFFFPPKNAISPFILAIFFLLNCYAFKKLKGSVERIFIPTLITAISLNLVMALNFYPNLLKYQASSQAGKMIAEHNIPGDMFFHYTNLSYSLDFYAKRTTPMVNMANLKSVKPGSWIFINQNGLNEFNENHISYKTIKVFPAFTITKLSLPFLCAETRSKTIDSNYLIIIQPK